MAIWMFCFMSVGLILLSVSSAISSCGSYQCQNTNKRWFPCVCMCDEEDDCEDRSDEANCTNLLCPQCDHRCQSGRCIPVSWKCDGSNDCGNGDKGNELPDCDEKENSSTVRTADLSMSSTVATMETDFTSTEVKTESSSTVRVADLSSMSSTVAAMKTESDDPRTLNSSTQSPTGSYSVTDAGSNDDKSNSPNIGLIVGVVVGVGGGVILIIVAVLIGIIIRRRRLEKQDRFTNPSVNRQNPNRPTVNENSYGNPIIPPYASFDELTTYAQPHFVHPYESLATDGTYATTGTQETDVHVGRNMETGESSSLRPSDPVNSNNEASNYDNFNTTAETDTNLVENDLYGDENYTIPVKKDLLGIDNDTTLVENDLYGNENDTTLVENDLYGNQNDTTLVENDLYWNENDTTLVENDLYGNKNDTTLVENDLYGNENDTTLVENDLYGK